MPRILLYFLAFAVVACNSDSCPNPIFLIPNGTRAYVAYRDGSGAWALPKPNSDGLYEMCVASQLEVVTVCENDDGTFTADDYHSLASEQTELEADACNQVGSGTPVTVTGSVTVPGSIGIEDENQEGSSTPWTYTLTIPAGTYDVVSSSSFNGSDGNVLIQRGQSFSADATFNVDPTTGTPLASEPISLQGLGSAEDFISIATSYFTPSTEAVVAITSSSNALAVPFDDVPSGDSQDILITALGSDGTAQQIDGPFATDGSAAAVYEVLPILDGIAFSTTEQPVSASWPTLPGFSLGEFEVATHAGIGSGSGSAGAVSIQRVSFSVSWQETVDAKSVTFDTTAPGYQPQWEVNLADGFNEALTIILEDANETSFTSTTVDVDPTGAATPAARPPSHHGIRRVRN